MAESSSAGDIAKTIGDLIAGFAPEGPLRTLVYVVYGLCAAIAPFIFKYYLGLLAQGAKPEGSIERQDYHRLRASLKEGNLAARLYAKWLTKFLDWIERFFGDAGMADRTLFPHAFGLKKPAPLWTAPAFDRCLLLAFIYPIMTIFLIWAVSGHVGPAEAALGLKHVQGWLRGSAVASLLFACFALLRPVRIERWKSLALISVAVAGAFGFAVGVAFADAGAGAFSGAVAGAFTFAFGFARAVAGGGAVAVARAVTFGGAVAVAGAIALAFVVAFAYAGSGAFVVAVVVVLAGAFAIVFAAAGDRDVALFPSVAGFAVAFAFVVVGAGAAAGALTFAFAVTFGVAGAVAIAVAGAGAVTVAVAGAFMLISGIAIKHRWQGLFLALFLPAMIVVCLVAAESLRVQAGPLLLFLGLLTLLNAPFDWASLGLTRALLRRGLELGGWWPYLFALVDACLAGIVITLLALTMVIGVQAFDELAVHGGGEKAAVLPLDALFDGIALNPGAPEYWWAYALLLSTMIPSLVNLTIGGMALTRGIPGVPRLLLRWIPEGRDVPDYRRPLAALGLTVQMFSGAALGVSAQAVLAWVLLFYVMPTMRIDLLWLCQKLAELDLPGKFFHLTGIIR